MTSSRPRTVHLAVDLSGLGARPAVWRTHGSVADRPFDPGELVELVATAERGALDLVALGSDFSLRPTASGTGGRLDAARAAAHLASRTSRIGLVATVADEHTEPTDVAHAVVTVDHSSAGRAGWQLELDGAPVGADQAGRSGASVERARAAEAAVDAVRRAWDVYEGVPSGSAAGSTGRSARRGFVARDGVHFSTDRAAERRLAQSRPPVVVRTSSPAGLDAAGRVADVVRVRAADAATAALHRDRVRLAAERAGRDPDDVVVLVDLYAVIGPDRASAHARLELLTDVEGTSWDIGSYTHVGTSGELSDLVADWVAAEATDGFTVHPSSPRADLHGLVDGVVPQLRAEGLVRQGYAGATLREVLGLDPDLPSASSAGVRRAVPA